MTIPHYDDTALERLDTDALLMVRVEQLVGRALRRQLWLMFLDHDDVQLPLLMPSDIPRTPEVDSVIQFADFLIDVVAEVRATSVVFVLERFGTDTISDDDRLWLQLVTEAGRLAGVRVRGPFLSHEGGVRTVGSEDIGPPRLS
ncbi:MAG: hypothetical protein ABWX66_04955 [Lacisediminihabitans sp.]